MSDFSCTDISLTREPDGILYWLDSNLVFFLELKVWIVISLSLEKSSPFISLILPSATGSLNILRTVVVMLVTMRSIFLKWFMVQTDLQQTNETYSNL